VLFDADRANLLERLVLDAVVAFSIDCSQLDRELDEKQRTVALDLTAVVLPPGAVMRQQPWVAGSWYHSAAGRSYRQLSEAPRCLSGWRRNKKRPGL
jgi:hypothetical protein